MNKKTSKTKAKATIKPAEKDNFLIGKLNEMEAQTVELKKIIQSLRAMKIHQEQVIGKLYMQVESLTMQLNKLRSEPPAPPMPSVN